MTTTDKGRWPIWTDIDAGGAMAASSRPTRVYRLADGGYLAILSDGSEVASVERPPTPGAAQSHSSGAA
jgi:hypothetical protein